MHEAKENACSGRFRHLKHEKFAIAAETLLQWRHLPYCYRYKTLTMLDLTL